MYKQGSSLVFELGFAQGREECRDFRGWVVCSGGLSPALVPYLAVLD